MIHFFAVYVCVFSLLFTFAKYDLIPIRYAKSDLDWQSEQGYFYAA